jgi:hypothetical protein
VIPPFVSGTVVSLTNRIPLTVRGHRSSVTTTRIPEFGLQRRRGCLDCDVLATLRLFLFAAAGFSLGGLTPTAQAETKTLGRKTTAEELAPDCAGQELSTVTGHVRALSLSERVIRIGRDGQGGLIQTGSAEIYKIAGNCRIVRHDGQVGSILDIAPGTYVQVQFSLTKLKTRLACIIIEQKPAAAAAKPPPAAPGGTSYTGRIAAISPLQNRVRVRHIEADTRKVYSSDEPQSMSFSVSPSCPIVNAAGQPIRLREIPLQARATVWYRFDRNDRNIEPVATHIQLQQP